MVRTFLVLSTFATIIGTHAAHALMPLAPPAGTDAVENGSAAPFQGQWTMSLPTMEMGESDAVLATCDSPVHIEPANQTHIFYRLPEQTEPDAAIELVATDGGTAWEPIAGGPSYFTFWVSPDAFYLYDAVPQTEADWGRPYIYRRCP